MLNRLSIMKFCFLFALLLLAALFGCAQKNDDPPIEQFTRASEIDNIGPYDEPDKLGSWGQINKILKRGNDWQQIVQNSQFKLGKLSFKGLWNGTFEAYYEIKLGSYPRIDGSTVTVPMAVEFAWQHLGLSGGDEFSFVRFSTTHRAYGYLILKQSNNTGMIWSKTAFLDDDHPVDGYFGDIWPQNTLTSGQA